MNGAPTTLSGGAIEVRRGADDCDPGVACGKAGDGDKNKAPEGPPGGTLLPFRFARGWPASAPAETRSGRRPRRQLGVDRREELGDVFTKGEHDTDHRNRDAGGDQGVLDGRGARILVHQLAHLAGEALLGVEQGVRG